MHIDLYTKTIITLIVLLLAVIAVNPFFHPTTAAAQSGVPYGYLQPQAGGARMNGEGMDRVKQFIDLRNGNSWVCDYQTCRLDGRFPLEKIK
jgi:hypothetical protein